MIWVKEEFQRADGLFTTFSRFCSKIIAFVLAMNKNSATRDSPNTIPKRRGKYCAAFDCNNSYYGVDGHRTSYRFRSTQRNRSTKYPLHRPMFFWLANFSLLNWLVIFFCFYGMLLGDQLQNKFAWDFNYFLCCWLETANRLRSGWRLITGLYPYRKLPTFLHAMFIAFHVAVVLFFFNNKGNAPLLATLVGIRFQKPRVVM